ncbi:unnamed protein product [Bathycoccus prasinos]
MGDERDSFLLWDVVVKCDDICFKHILPKLNRTDLKFLHGVNTETRKLIKRSSRANDLKKGFKVKEMSSISTLEFAWEHKSLWPRWWTETYFCEKVAKTNKLELLKWAREEKKCEWCVGTTLTAAEQGNLEMVKYCVANQCPINTGACAWAAGKGNLEMLKYLREEAKVPWTSRTATSAAKTGHLHILEYLVELKYYEYDEDACASAAKYGQLDCLKYLRETAKAPWDFWAKQKPPPPPPTGRMHARKVDPPLNPNDGVDAQKEQKDPIPATIPTEKKRMTAQEYVEARKEMKPPPVSGKQQKNFMNEMVSSVLAPGYKFVVGLPKNSLKFVVEKFTTIRGMFRVNAIAVLSKLPTGKMDVNKFGGYLADAFLLLFTLAVLRVVHLFTPFAKPPPASVKTRKIGSDRVNIQFHMPFAGGADKCIVFLKGNKVLCRCPEKMLECETTLSAPAKGSTWIIFEEPKWLEYKDELVVVAKSVKKDKEAKKIEKMPLKTPAARKKSASRTTDEGEEDRAPAKARASRKTTTATKAKKTPAARAKSPASPRRTRQTPAKKK